MTPYEVVSLLLSAISIVVAIWAIIKSKKVEKRINTFINLQTDSSVKIASDNKSQKVIQTNENGPNNATL